MAARAALPSSARVVSTSFDGVGDGETMADPVAVHGVVATRPRHVIPEVGAPVATFRLVTGPRFAVCALAVCAEDGMGADPGADPGGDGSRYAQGNWYTVIATHRLAESVGACVAHGDPLVVAGRLRVRDWAGEPEGVTAEIDADAIGHDLAWGRSVFTRRVDGAALVAHREVRGVPTGAEP